MNILDQSRLHQQRVHLGVGWYVVDIGNQGNHVSGASVLSRGTAEVAARPAIEILCLADINHPALGVFHQINARRVRKTPHFLRWTND